MWLFWLLLKINMIMTGLHVPPAPEWWGPRKRPRPPTYMYTHSP